MTVVIILLVILALLFMAFPGYFIVLLIGRLFSRRQVKKSDILPPVTFITAAYNEESVIEEKLLNTLEIDYPSESFEIIVASDCSTDGTDEIVSRYASRGIKLVRASSRRGKTGAQNESLRCAKGDILVFSDANTMYSPDAIRKLVANFADPDVGCVGGRLVYVSDTQRELVSEKGLYERVDQYIKKLESDIYSCIGLDGAIYAIRKELARPIPESLTTDFMVPLDVIVQGYRVVFEGDAVVYEEIPSSSYVEFRRKIRTVRAGATALYAARRLLNPFKFGWAAWFLIFHKVLRWMTPFFLVLLLLVTYFLSSHNVGYRLLFWAQLIFYVLALAGGLIRRTFPLKILTVPFFFCMTSISALWGLVLFLRGRRSEVWDVKR